MPDPPLDTRPLTERRRPRRLEELTGNARAIEEFLRWAKRWEGPGGPPRTRAAVLMGPPGVGKTTLAWALAGSLGWTVVEMNASEARNQTAVELVAGRASLTHTLGTEGVFRRSDEGGRAMILLDEADSMHGGRTSEASAARPAGPSLREFLRGRYGTTEALATSWGLGSPGRPKPFESWADVPASGGRATWTRIPEAARDLSDWKGAARPSDTSDRGGYSAIVRLVRETLQPVVLTVNDEQELYRHASALRSLATPIRLEPIPLPEMTAYLRKVNAVERLGVDDDVISSIAERCRGDLRAALNDLEALAPLGGLAASSMSIVARDADGRLAELVRAVLNEPRYYRSGEIRDRVDESPEELAPWFEENVPRSATNALGRSRGIEAVARADVHLSRARRFRVYSLWSYASELLTGGASLALASAGVPRSAPPSFPSFLSVMGRSRVTRGLRDALLGRLGTELHMSRRKGADSTLPFLDGMLRPDRTRDRTAFEGWAREFALQIGLNEAEAAYLGVPPDLLPVSVPVEAAAAEDSEDGDMTAPAEKAGVPREAPAGAVAPPPPKEPAPRKRVQRRLTSN